MNNWLFFGKFAKKIKMFKKCRTFFLKVDTLRWWWWSSSSLLLFLARSFIGDGNDDDGDDDVIKKLCHFCRKTVLAFFALGLISVLSLSTCCYDTMMMSKVFFPTFAIVVILNLPRSRHDDTACHAREDKMPKWNFYCYFVLMHV